ncbi:MAG TPA: PAS domain-containing protein, partial [Steroidobacteraceae bacterium]|nr:PAS domain-containing protein [Steroidobacteraceae bacterium]
MFGYFTFIWPLIVGICLYAAFTHLQIGLRRPIDRAHGLFGTLALCVAVFVVGNIQLATAQTPAQYQTALWVFSIAWLAFFSLLPWFVTAYAQEPQRWPALTVSAVYGVIFVANLLSPHSILQAESPSLQTLTMPWGEHWTRSTTRGTAMANVLSAAHVLVIAYLAFACVGLFRRGPKPRARALILCAIPLAASLVANWLVEFGIVNFSYVVAPALMVPVLVMSVGLTLERRRTHAQMQSVLDNVPAIVYLKRIDGRYAFVNRRFEQLHGRNAAAVLGKTDADLFAADRAAKGSQHDLAALAGHTIEWEETIDHSGTPRIYATTCFALRDSDNAPYALCGIATDITERKNAADSLRYLAANLERRVARRTDELARLNQELETFAYSVSHDLRAPLTAVNGFADLLLREHATKLDQNGHRYLQRIRDGSLRMGSLIQNLLGLSRVSQQSLQLTSIDLTPLFSESLKTLRETDPERHVEVRIQECMQATGDP